MKISSNIKLIQRNKKISQIILFASLGFLIIGLIWSFTSTDASQTTLSYAILMPAYILVQISIYMANRWGRSPRPDEIIEQSLKGLNNQFTLYNYTTGVSHLLVGPSGVIIIKPYHHTGEITYNPEKERFEQKGGPNFIAKLFAQESLPNIARETRLLIHDFQKYVSNNNLEIPYEPEIINVFYSEKADVHTRQAPNITTHADKLKDAVRSQAKQKNLRHGETDMIRDQLPKANV